MELITSRLYNKYPFLKNYKPGLDFLARLFFIGVILIVLKVIYGYFMDINGNIVIPSVGTLNLIESLRQFLLFISHNVLQFFGYNSAVAGWTIGINKARVVLQTPCLGINVCFAFLALVAAFPSPRKTSFKILYIIAGLIIIQSFNVGRIILMVFVVKNQWVLPIEHHDLFNIVIYTVIFILFYYFINIKPTSKKPTTSHRQPTLFIK